MKIIDFLVGLLNDKKLPPKVSVSFDASSVVFPTDYQDISLLLKNAPQRSEDALSGSQFGASVISISATQQRDNLILEQCVAGNMPSWMRSFKKITVADQTNTLEYFVSPDVLCVGNDTDFLRVSLNGYTAQRAVQAFDCMLPTKKISDQIWQAADLKLIPAAMGASFQMITSQTMISHNALIEKQRAGRAFNILTGHKKDIVYTKHLLVDRTRLAIYGWHMLDSHAIQGPGPNSTSHSVEYQDYSSSIRLVSRTAMLNGQTVDLSNLINDPKFCYLVSDEIPYDVATIYKIP